MTLSTTLRTRRWAWAAWLPLALSPLQTLVFLVPLFVLMTLI